MTLGVPRSWSTSCRRQPSGSRRLTLVRPVDSTRWGPRSGSMPLLTTSSLASWGAGDLEGHVVDADDLFAADRVNFQDRLVFAGQLELGRAAVVLGAQQQLEAELFVEFDELVDVTDD